MNRHTMGKNLTGLKILGIVFSITASILAWSACADGPSTGAWKDDMTEVVPTTALKGTVSGEERPSITERTKGLTTEGSGSATISLRGDNVMPTAESLPTVAEPTSPATMGEVLPAAAEPTATPSSTSTEVASNVHDEKPEPPKAEPAPTPTAASVTAATESQTIQGGAAPAVTGDPHYDSSSLEERINLADIISRVEFVSVSAAVAHIKTDEGTLYSPGVSYRFNVLEYLKGDEGDQIEAIAYAYSYYDDESQAREAAKLILPEAHDKRWEHVQSIIFLHEDTVDGNGLLSSHQHQFVIAGTGVSPVGNFHIDNEYNKVWLPAAWGDTPESDIGDGIEFLLDDPDNYDDKLEIPTITLENLREFVEDLQEEHDVGVSEHGKKIYKACLVKKYNDMRFDEQREYRRYDIEDVPSGLPSGTQILTEENWGRTPQRKTLHLVDYIEGKDAELFSVDPFYFHTVRPIPQGTYRFYRWGYGEAPDDRVRHACGADILSEKARTSIEFFIHVVAPDDTIHEAFFDPVSLESGVGATASEGSIAPSVFAQGGQDSIKIDRISWHQSKAAIVLSDATELGGHHIDFIALDGSTSLRLDFDEALQAAAPNDTQSLSWGVCEQPWQDGDLLLIRISESGAGLTSATNDAECATAAAP